MLTSPKTIFLFILQNKIFHRSSQIHFMAEKKYVFNKQQYKKKVNLTNNMKERSSLYMPINRINLYLTFGFFAEPPPALPFGFVSVVAAFFLRFKPLLAAIGLSAFLAVGVVVVTLRDTEKNLSSRPC